MPGKSIRIYLVDGKPTGVKHAEIVNWTGQAMSVPRSRLGEVSNWDEVSRPGIYFLFGAGEEFDQPIAYIGESENIYKRLGQHIDKDFWNTAVLFTSKDENLTKGHILYLEAKAITVAQEVGRYELINGNSGSTSSLPRADQDSMEEFFQNLKVLLGTLGHRILEPLLSKSTSHTGEETLNEADIILTFESKDFKAKGVQADEGFIVLKGSSLALEAKTSLADTLESLRKKAIKDGRLTRQGNILILNVDLPFTSSSYAASFVAGSARNGRISWKNSKGETLKEMEEKLAETQMSPKEDE